MVNSHILHQGILSSTNPVSAGLRRIKLVPKYNAQCAHIARRTVHHTTRFAFHLFHSHLNCTSMKSVPVVQWKLAVEWGPWSVAYIRAFHHTESVTTGHSHRRIQPVPVWSFGAEPTNTSKPMCIDSCFHFSALQTRCLCGGLVCNWQMH